MHFLQLKHLTNINRSVLFEATGICNIKSFVNVHDRFTFDEVFAIPLKRQKKLFNCNIFFSFHLTYQHCNQMHSSKHKWLIKLTKSITLGTTEKIEKLKNDGFIYI